MNYDKLVQYIVEQIYENINKSEENICEILKGTAVILDDNSIEYSALKEEYEVLAYDESIETCDVLIIGKLGLKELANISQGIMTSKREEFILTTLMNGKKVYVIENGIEYKNFKNKAPKTLYKKYIQFEEDLKGFGVEIIEDAECILNTRQILVEKVQDCEIKKQDNNCNNEACLGEELDLTSKKLISESDLRKPKINGIKYVVISKKSIITPLANDFIRINKLAVKRV